MPAPVTQAIREHLDRETRIGGYEAADAAAEALGRAYEDVAALVGAEARNIAFVENATVATQQALSSFDFAPGDVVLTSNADYVSNQTMLLSLARRQGVRVVRAEDRPEGGVDPASVRRLIEEETPRLVLLSWIPTNSGFVQEAESVGAACREAGVPFVLDACQAVGQLPVDVEALGCDFLAATARKFLRGPRGAGFLYAADRVLDDSERYPLFLDLRGGRWTAPNAFEPEPTAQRFENWEFAYALVLGLGAAAHYTLGAGVEEIGERAAALARYARRQVGALPGARVLDRGTRRCAISTFAFAGAEPEVLSEQLRAEGVNTSVATRVRSPNSLDGEGPSAALRVSPHYYNTPEEIDRLTETLEALLEA